MPFEPTTLTMTVRMISEALEKRYNIDPGPLFKKAGLDIARMAKEGARYPVRRMRKLWKAAIEATGDPCIGLAVGKCVRPTSFHALGLSWFTSRTLLESFQRVVRYYRLISTLPLKLEIGQDNDHYVLSGSQPEGEVRIPLPGVDAFVMSLLKLARQASDRQFRPDAVYLVRGAEGKEHEYVEAFDCPVFFNAEKVRILVPKAMMDAPLPGRNAELARANDRIAERYIEALDPDRVSTHVRKLLVDLLPAGKAGQTNIAGKLHRSTSTMQRQLRAEGTSYRDVLEETRAELARQYLRDRTTSLSEIAFLLGFSDQSNFSRAFKRWTGKSPGEYRAG